MGCGIQAPRDVDLVVRRDFVWVVVVDAEGGGIHRHVEFREFAAEFGDCFVAFHLRERLKGISAKI